MAAVRKLKGSDNNYLWQPGLQAGVPGPIRCIGRESLREQGLGRDGRRGRRRHLSGHLFRRLRPDEEVGQRGELLARSAGKPLRMSIFTFGSV